MAILERPLFSDEARGQVSKVAVFKRSQVHPVFCGFSYHQVNWTPDKIAQGAAWKSLCNAWRSLSDSDQAFWSDNAPGVLTGFNYFMHFKGSLPFPFCYKSPVGDSLFYNFSLFPYNPPSGDSIIFDWEECI